jgi:hypothetical protein
MTPKITEGHRPAPKTKDAKSHNTTKQGRWHYQPP